MGVKIPLSCPPQVSNYLDNLDVDYTDIIKGNLAHPGAIFVIFDPSRWGGAKIAKIAIVFERGARSIRPFGQLIWYVFARGLRPSRAITFTSLVSGDLDAP
jgi:hypothetical protein